MRAALAFVALMCGATSANAAEPHSWCTDGFEAPAVLSWSADGRTMFLGSEQWEYVGPVGAGAGVSLGTTYRNASGEALLRYTTVTVEADENPGWREVSILLFRDRRLLALRQAMRTVMAMVALFCVAASADAAERNLPWNADDTAEWAKLKAVREWCSDDERITIPPVEDWFRIGRLTVFNDLEEEGDGLDPRTEMIWIIQDRIYRPCEKNE